MPDNFDNERPDNERWDKARWDESLDARTDRRRRKLERRLERRQWSQAPAPRLLIAIVLIAAGTLMFLSNLGLLPEFNIWAFWPLIFVVAGVGKLVRDTNSAARALSVLLIAFGSLFTLLTLGILHFRAHDDSWIFSLLLIGFGSVALIKILEGRDYPGPQIGFTPQGVSSGNVVREQVVFGSVKRKVESNDFQGGKLESVFGSIDLNLRRAQIASPERSATIEVNAVFGSIELRVPETWRIVTHAAGIFGSVEDKTLANKVAGFDGSTLFITGAAVFGSVEIKD
jgi:predicted membrane protein